MKKYISILAVIVLAIAIMVAVVGCSSKDKNTDNEEIISTAIAVTDANGEEVTDANGETVTKIVTQIVTKANSNSNSDKSTSESTATTNKAESTATANGTTKKAEKTTKKSGTKTTAKTTTKPTTTKKIEKEVTIVPTTEYTTIDADGPINTPDEPLDEYLYTESSGLSMLEGYYGEKYVVNYDNKNAKADVMSYYIFKKGEKSELAYIVKLNLLNGKATEFNVKKDSKKDITKILKELGDRNE